MDVKSLWYALSSIAGVMVGALTTAWTFGRRYQAIVQTQRDQGDSITKLWKAHEDNKSEVDKRLVEIGGKMIGDLAVIKQAVAVTNTQMLAHLDSCVTQRDMTEIMDRLGHVEGVVNGGKKT